MAGFFMVMLMLFSILLILVILIQRGRGGGLAGAFGGAGGQSAFGTKAGDVFTKITIVLITVWVLLAGASGVLARRSSERLQAVPAASSDSMEGVAPGAGATSKPSDSKPAADSDPASESSDSKAAPENSSPAIGGEAAMGAATSPSPAAPAKESEGEGSKLPGGSVGSDLPKTP